MLMAWLETLAGPARPGQGDAAGRAWCACGGRRWPQNSFLASSVPLFSGSDIVFLRFWQKVGPAGPDSGPGILGDPLENPAGKCARSWFVRGKSCKNRTGNRGKCEKMRAPEH